MGRGDRRTRKGKQFRNSHGNTRPKGEKKTAQAAAASQPAAPAAAPKAGRGKA